MGKAWDDKGGPQAFQAWTSLWAQEAYRCLKPGGYLLVFCGTRTYHRMACGIEDAGFEVRDMIEWLYLSGFPKSMNVSKQFDKQFDKQAGAEREVVGPGRWHSPGRTKAWGDGKKYGTVQATTEGHDGKVETKPAADLAQRWNGWGTALKPAHETICLARKPKTLNDLTTEELQEVYECLSSLVLAAVRSSVLSPSVLDEVCVTARWSVGGNTSTSGDLFAQTDMSQFVPILENTNWNTVFSCLNTLADRLNGGNTFTTETALSTITDLRTLSWLRSPNTLESMLQARTQNDGSSASVSLAATDLNAELSRLADTFTRSVPESATSSASEPAQRLDHTPIVMARKPLEKTVCANVEKYGTGAINVDGCRIATTDKLGGGKTSGSCKSSSNDGWNRPFMDDEAHMELVKERERAKVAKAEELGRFPANCVTLDDDAWFSPYFNISPQELSKKASKKDRNSDWRGNQIEVITWENADLSPEVDKLSRLLRAIFAGMTHLSGDNAWSTLLCGSTIMDLFQRECKSTTLTETRLTTTFQTLNLLTLSPTKDSIRAAILTAEANGLNLAETAESISLSLPSITNEKLASLLGAVVAALKTLCEISASGKRGNVHSTVKPIDLMRWLQRLVTPPGGITASPFLGSGTDAVAAILEGFDFWGMEKDGEYWPIIEARVSEAQQPTSEQHQQQLRLFG
jgi:DNA modification methylase